MTRILVAGMGNVLRADDGFGIRVIERLRSRTLPLGTELYEAGGAGIALAQKLMDGFEACIIVDAAKRGGTPGTLYCITPQVPESPRDISMHELEPSRVLALARALGALPATVLLVGCEPEQTEELREQLSPPVEAAVRCAMEIIFDRLTHFAEWQNSGPSSWQSQPGSLHSP